MKSIDFPQANMAVAKNQPQYQTLYVKAEGKEVAMTACMELTDEEVEEIVRTRKLWHTQITGGRGYAPIQMSTRSPYEDLGEVSPPMDENRTPADLWDATHYQGTVPLPFPNTDGVVYVGDCKNCGSDADSHYWSTLQCKL